MELRRTKETEHPFNTRYLLGQVLFQMGRAEEALPELQRALTHPNAKGKPQAREIQMTIAISLEMAGQLADARKTYEALIREDPENPLAKTALSHLQGISRQTIQLLTESAARNKAGKHDLALQNLDAIDAAPPHASYLRGLIAFHQARYEESVTFLRKAALELSWYPMIYHVMRKAHLALTLNLERLKFLMDQIALVNEASKTPKESCPSILAKAEAELATVWFPGFYACSLLARSKWAEWICQPFTQGSIKVWLMPYSSAGRMDEAIRARSS